MRKGKWIILFAVMACIVTAVCLLTDPFSGRAADGSKPGNQTEAAPEVEADGVPERLLALIEENTFSPRKAGASSFRNRDIYASSDRVILVDYVTGSDGIPGATVSLYDACGTLLAEHQVPELNKYICQALATSDGGFLYVIGFQDRQFSDGSWASEQGILSKVVKCGPDGSVEWEAEFEDLNYYAFCRAFERNNAYYFFGNYDAYVKEPGRTTWHVNLLKLDRNGNLLKRNTIGGSDFDTVDRAELTDEGFLLHIQSQSRDGDFFPIEGESQPYYGRYFAAEIDEDLELRSMQLEKSSNVLVGWQPIGVLHGKELYRYDAGLDVPGYPELVLDYGDVYLVVSEHNTREYEHTPPMVSSRWYYTETVYSLFDQSGKLLYQKRFDSSPSFEAIISPGSDENESGTR